MAPRRKIRTAAKEASLPVVGDKSSVSSHTSTLRFWLILTLLCLGGYLYYEYAQECNIEARHEQRKRVQENKQIREGNKNNSLQRREKEKQRALAIEQKRREYEEIAAREAKEREVMLAAEELNQLREMDNQEQMHNPYRDEEPEPLPEESPRPAKNAVVSALEQYDVFNAKPKENAEYYIYLCSAGWCGNCVRELKSTVAREYKEIRKTPNVELILISFDRSLEEAHALPKKSKLKCPTLWVEDMRKRVFQRLPGFADMGNAVPLVFIVDKDGLVIIHGHGSLLKDWKRIVDDVEKLSRQEMKEGGVPH